MCELTKITVKLTPKASKNEVQGWIKGPDGEKILKCRVTAVPEKGKANKALIALPAKHWKIPKSDIRMIRGETDRIKTLEVREGPQTVLSKEP